MTVLELAQAADVTFAHTYKDLRVLLRAGLVTKRAPEKKNYPWHWSRAR